MKVSDALNSMPNLELAVLLAAVFLCSILGTALMRHLAGRARFKSSQSPKRNMIKDPTSKAPNKRVSSERLPNDISSH